MALGDAELTLAATPGVLATEGGPRGLGLFMEATAAALAADFDSDRAHREEATWPSARGTKRR